MRYLLPILSSSFLLSILLASPVHAQTGKIKGITISPAYLEVVLDKPGEKKDVQIEVLNNTAKEITLDVYPLDFKQKDEFGAIGFLGLDNSYSYSLSSFLSFATRQLILKPNEKRTVDVSITNREDLSPGGHYAAVVVRQTGTDATQDATSVSPSLSSLLLIHKTGGERFNLSLLKSFWPEGFFAFSYPRFYSLLLQNEGNIHVTPYGRVEIKDMLGRKIYDGMINPSSLIILPESRRIIDVVMTKLTMSLPISLNTIVIEGRDSLNKTSYRSKDVFLYVNPVFVIGLVLVLILLAVVLRRKKK